ncbi:cytochrome P450 71D9-like [Senna tora]|uniref:Cytochrome P450 71D9-like n=1 Tax=Senna tora TaxID=362788 RepID=A0A834T6H2_9FABA|nr:cytochrome P450 71D9-like [Senna tora]
MDHHLSHLLASPTIFSSLIISILFLILISLKLVKLLRAIFSGRKVVSPPGPWRLPIVGSIHHLGGTTSSSLPHRRFKELSLRYGPLMHLQLGQVSTVVVSSAEIAQEVLKTNDLIFANRPCTHASEILLYGPSDIIFSPFGHHWKLLRKIASLQMLNGRRVRSLQSMWIKKEVSSLMKSLKEEAGSCVNLSEKVFVTISGITSRSAFGKKHNKGRHLEAIMQVSERISESTHETVVSHLFPSWKWLQVLVGETRVVEEICRNSDLVLRNILVGEEEEEEDDDDEEEEGECLLKTLLEMKDQEAPPTLVEWAMAEMMKNPRIMRKAQAEVRQAYRSKGHINETNIEELEYLKAIIKETLRLHPPAPLMAPRECTQTCEINGYTIPTGTQVIVNVWAIERDSKYWGSSAEEFLPERFVKSWIDYRGSNFEYIPFGAGKRICPGMGFGVGIVEIVLAHLLCFFDWELPSGITAETLDMGEYLSSTLRRKNKLILIPISCI